jgi:putative chitinase
MTPAELQAAIPGSGARAHTYAQALTAAMLEFGIATGKQQSAFLAQLAHESGSLRYVREIADGSAYEGRADLGNTQVGDGPRFKGRGFLQITGRANYAKCGAALNLDLIATPDLLEVPSGAARSAGWYWKSRNLNQYADTDAFGALTKAINGGYNGLDDRIRHWLVARKALGVA